MATNLQYLVKCNDKSYCILYKKSIIYNKESLKLEVGGNVEFYWPEDQTKKTWKGIIKQISGKKLKLLQLSEKIKNIFFKF